MSDTDRIARGWTQRPPSSSGLSASPVAAPPALRPAAQLANLPPRYPSESAPYREARNALLAEEIELRRHIERVAAQRRALPPGGEVGQTFMFEGEEGAVSFA